MKIKKYDIAITKPWSKEMYDHNDNVLEDVKSRIQNDWQTAYHKSEDLYYNNGSADEDELDFSDQELENISYWRAKEISEDLSLSLSKEFIGLG